jgi:hypothetical protein
MLPRDKFWVRKKARIVEEIVCSASTSSFHVSENVAVSNSVGNDTKVAITK